jgi:hypothetical protein
MERLNDIWNSLVALYKDEVRFYTLKGVEKASLLLGLLGTIVIISVFCLLVLIFGSIALANFLNAKLASGFIGYLIVTGAYLIVMVLMFIWMVKRKTPLLTNIFVKSLISIFNIPEDEDQ